MTGVIGVGLAVKEHLKPLCFSCSQTPRQSSPLATNISICTYLVAAARIALQRLGEPLVGRSGRRRLANCQRRGQGGGGGGGSGSGGTFTVAELRSALVSTAAVLLLSLPGCGAWNGARVAGEQLVLASLATCWSSWSLSLTSSFVLFRSPNSRVITEWQVLVSEPSRAVLHY